jgi:tellurium resistance protein TerZ
MTISLAKGQSLSLSKASPGLARVFMGLGWDPVKKPAGGFFSKIFGGGQGDAGDIDLDASVLVLDSGKRILDAVHFRKLQSDDGAIKHGGDNLTGDGDGDDEVIYVELNRLDSRAAHLVFTVNSFRGQTFNEVDNAVARLVNQAGNREICTFTLREQGSHTGVIMASLSKSADGTWTMKAHGVPAQGRTVQELIGDAQRVL